MTRTRQAMTLAAVAASALLLAGCASANSAGGTDGEAVDADALVGATYASSEEGEPQLTFADDGTYTGTDGCNGLQGEYEITDDEIVLDPGISTLKACEGVDTWLRDAKTLQVDGDAMVVFDSSDAEIGTLALD
ncbi:META domain-containing protein [Microbacterium sp. G2-8]|uniref:META domain-containing protein n=1 Tax=Microbacterium sp. G2-8 TaxID=2842454 RepID=UPI0021A9F577|nr:META domain-containing protein [Microbacterium sp. G2-8]